jgi:KDO2-lipid IV(A) lauroyltransferase
MKKQSDFALYLLFKLIRGLFFLLPRRLCLFLGRMLGFFFFLIDTRHRNIALSNLKMALGDKQGRQSSKSLAHGSFLHFGEFIMDLIKFSTLREKRKSRLISVEGTENLKAALQKQKGVLLFTGHFGNWEIAPFLISRIHTLKVIARRLDNPFLERMLLKLRTDQGEEVIYKHKAARDVLRALKEKAMVAILIDQNVLRDEAVFVDFFGKQAATTPSLATFHLRTLAPIVPVFCSPQPDHTYQIKILPAVDTHLSGDHKQDVLKITQICTKIIEAQIRDNPEFWLWFHNRWKTRPDPEKNQPA